MFDMVTSKFNKYTVSEYNYFICASNDVLSHQLKKIVIIITCLKYKQNY